ncbi:hypothetical protein JCM21900_006250 [Sporobolomyces salmonicolor]
MSTPSAPPSPSKRSGVLRTILTGVQSTDPEVHARRWNRSGGAPPSPDKLSFGLRNGAAVGGGARVAGLVDRWEMSFSSKPYSALPAGPSSPNRPIFGSPPGGTAKPLPILGATQPSHPASSSSPSSSESRSSPTVPASFFQMQQGRRTPPSSPTKFIPYQPPRGKENQQRFPFDPAPRPSTSLLAHSGHISDPSRSPATTGTLSGNSDVSQVTSAFTDLTVETMATRSSDSTHASSIATNSAEGATLNVASRVEMQAEASPKKVLASHAGTSALSGRGLRAPPQIVETAPTPRREGVQGGSPRAARPVSVPVFQAIGHPYRPRSAQENRCGPAAAQAPPPRHPYASSFVEALPASYPSHSTDSSPLPSPTSPSEIMYKPLPLDNPPPSPIMKDLAAPAPTRPKTRARASTLGAELRPSFVGEQTREDSPEEKRRRVEEDFERLLDNMQLPDRTVREKMLGLAFPLKEEMLRSTPNPSGSSAALHPHHSARERGRSVDLAASQPASAAGPSSSASSSTRKEGGGGFKSTLLRKTKSNQSFGNSQSRSPSADSSKPRRPSHSRTASATSILLRSFGKSSGAAVAAEVGRKDGGADGEDAVWWAVRLRSTKCAVLEVKEMGKLRGRLRNEAPSWVDEFIKNGGYLGLLERLKEVLEVEWREEQHDDQILHELLKSFKALTLTACGKRALASHSPTPFLPLASLLFSEKRPGDLPCRQLLVELIASLFDICPLDAAALSKSAWSTPEVSLEPDPPTPPSSSTAFPAIANSSNNGSGAAGGGRRYTRKIKSSEDDVDTIEREEVLTPERIQQAHRMAMSLMEGPPNEKEEAKVDFIRETHRPRVFKTWVQEIADCVRDYFWIFCHSQNLFWTFEQLDVDAIERPKVPSGMTGGVEYEAMAYCTAHLRLINAIARTCSTLEAAFAFHDQLFQSGFERVLFTLRRASLVYYQSLHLEMSRYISLARSAQFNLGPRILACLDRRSLSRQELMVLQMVEQRDHQSRSGAPQIGAVF